MKILLTGTTGYIGKRLLPLLLEEGHEVICCVRDKHRIPDEKPFNHPSITFLEIDFLNDSLPPLPYNDIDVAFYFGYYLYAFENQRPKSFETIVLGKTKPY